MFALFYSTKRGKGPYCFISFMNIIVRSTKLLFIHDLETTPVEMNTLSWAFYCHHLI